MDRSQELAVQQKREHGSKQEKTIPARYFIPPTDIVETAEGLTVTMEVPGVDKKDLDISLENGVLRVDGKIDFRKYEGFEPVYSEYNVGNFFREFMLSDEMDPDGISADLANGVLTLTLKKTKQAAARRITVT